MTHDTWHMTPDMWHLTADTWYKTLFSLSLFVLLCTFLLLVLLPAHIKRFSVSCMRDFLNAHLKDKVSATQQKPTWNFINISLFMLLVVAFLYFILVFNVSFPLSNVNFPLFNVEFPLSFVHFYCSMLVFDGPKSSFNCPMLVFYCPMEASHLVNFGFPFSNVAVSLQAVET